MPKALLRIRLLIREQLRPADFACLHDGLDSGQFPDGLKALVSTPYSLYMTRKTAVSRPDNGWDCNARPLKVHPDIKHGHRQQRPAARRRGWLLGSPKEVVRS